MKKSRVQMEMYANLVIVSSNLWSRKSKDFRDFILAVDTGASRTVIDKDVLHRAGYDVTGDKVHRITTASGVEFVTEIVVDKLEIGNLVVESAAVYAHSFPQELFVSGLLGLDILSRFDVNFLFSNGMIEFTEINRL